MCLLAPTVTDKLDKAHLSSRSLFKERESADQYQAPTGVHSTQWVVLSANHYATVISPTCEKSRPCPPERSSSARLMMRWIFDQCQVSMWGLPFFPGGKQSSPNLGWSDELLFLAIVSDFPLGKADRRFAMDSDVNSRSGSEELALTTVILLTGKWSCHSRSWCVEPRSQHLHVAAGLSFSHERVEERRHSFLHHLDKMGRGTRGP